MCDHTVIIRLVHALLSNEYEGGRLIRAERKNIVKK